MHVSRAGHPRIAIGDFAYTENRFWRNGSLNEAAVTGTVQTQGTARRASMTWNDRLLIRRGAKGQSGREKLVQLGRRRFDVTLTPAELQVLNDTASSLDLPSPDDNAPRP
jgi:hypothetical protein